MGTQAKYSTELPSAARDAAVALAAGSILGPVTLTATSNASSGSAAVVAKSIDLTVNQTGTASGVSTALKVNVTETAALGQVRLLDLQVGGTSRWTILGTAPIVSAADATWDGFKAAAFTQTFKGNTRINSQISKMAIYAPTLASDTATLTIDKAATVYISGPPVAGSNVAITSAWALVAGGGVQIMSGGLQVGATVAWERDAAHVLQVGNSGTHSYANIGQSPTANLEFGWTYNATASAAVAKIVTYGYLNQLQLDAKNISLQSNAPSGNVMIGTASVGASAAKTLVLTNAATAPASSANLAHLYAADHGGVADSTALALYQEVATVTAGDNTADRYIPATVNGVAVWLLARSTAPV